MKKICFVTGSRAEYGILSTLMKLIRQDKEFKLQLVVTGMHLSADHGNTFQEIEEDGFKIDKKIDMQISSGQPSLVIKSMGHALIGFADALEDLKPDLMVVLGDRYEIMTVAQAAMILNIPVAHIHGGELTNGLIDDPIRHCLTKMSHLHFVSTETYRKRVIQMGELPDMVFNVGAPGLDRIVGTDLLSREQLEKELGSELGNYLVFTYHPVTLDKDGGISELNEVLDALVPYLKEHKFVFTMPNADPKSDVLAGAIVTFCQKHSQPVFKSLGSLKYLSLIKHSQAVIGNSSSGIVEAPSFHIPTVNIGDRQKGRVTGETVINVAAQSSKISEAIARALNAEFRKKIKQTVNPYGDGKSSARIHQQLKAISDYSMLIRKGFYDQ